MRRSSERPLLCAFTSLVACAALAFGCSGSDGEADTSAPPLAPATGGSPNVIVTTGGTGFGNQPHPSGSPDDCTPLDPPSACAGESYESENIPLDIYVLFDQSGSMCTCLEGGTGACPDPTCEKTRLDAVREAMDEFLEDPESAGIGIGIGYFGNQPIGSASCNDADYRDAAVEIGVLPDHATAISKSLASVSPIGETPTGAALRGACEYARSRRESAKGREIVILLLTDGKPEAPLSCKEGTCCPDLDDAVAAASECRSGNLGVKTYVLGVGPLLGNLAEIAEAGGTEHAYLVEGGDVSREVLNALNRIRGDAAIPCELKLPEPPAGTVLSYDQVNIKYADSECQSTYFYYVESADACGDNGGWYYDDPSAPERIHLCPTTCDQVAAPGGRLYYTVGCATIFKPH
ncbi:MAG TPA: vWA domain-containing protein [Polyangiaceae bacterium]|nr:vWA domain-containing protein [Polyangiaceae bacterium]